MIRTVLGDISPQSIGHTQCHEHIFLQKGVPFKINPALCMDNPDRSLEELLSYRRAGGQTIVDAQPVGCGRSAESLVELSKKSGIHIIAVTGFHKKMFIEPDSGIMRMSQAQLERLYTSEIEEGMYEPDGRQISAKAGIIKAAFEPDGFSDPIYKRLFAAVAVTAEKTGAHVMIHTEPNTDILKLIKYFADAGISANRLIICHLDRTHYDISYHEEILSSGCCLCYDSINRLKYISNEQELALIAAMIKAGFGKQILLSLDATNQRLRSYYATNMGLDFIIKNFIPDMKSEGIQDIDIDNMCKNNAQKALQIIE